MSHLPSVIAGEACPLHLVFWQPIPSFHQEGFLCALAQADWVASVTLKYELKLPPSRRDSGWRVGEFLGVRLEQIEAEEVPEDEVDIVHFFTGFDTHPAIWAAFNRLPARSQCRRFAFAEAPECIGLAGHLRRLKYRRASTRIASRLDGMLAMGQLGVDFYRTVLPQSVPVYGFAYYDVSEADLSQLALDRSDSQPPALRFQRSVGIPQPYQFLYVGQLIKRKGVDRLIKALALCEHRGWSLDIVGSGQQQLVLQKLASRLGGDQQIRWHASVAHDTLASFYSAADCVVLSSRWDGWGMTVNEALRYGCNVLVSQACGAASAVGEERCLPTLLDGWPERLCSEIERGKLTHECALLNQALAQKLSGEAGTEVLKNILLQTEVVERTG